MSLRSDGRHIVSVTMQPELYAQLYEACKRLDLPVTVWVREAIKRELQRQEQGTE